MFKVSDIILSTLTLHSDSKIDRFEKIDYISEEESLQCSQYSYTKNGYIITGFRTLDSWKSQFFKPASKKHLELIKKEIGDLKISNLQTSDLDKIYNQPLSKTKISNFNRAFFLLFDYAKHSKYIEEIIEIPKYEPKEMLPIFGSE